MNIFAEASSTSIIPFIHRRAGEKCTLRDGYDRVATRAKTKQISISRNRADLLLLIVDQPRGIGNSRESWSNPFPFSIGGNKSSTMEGTFFFYFDE